MEPIPKSNSRSALRSASHLKSYDPSEQYREVMVPRPPSATTTTQPNNQYSSNPVLLENDISTMNDPRNGVIQRIPQYYYPRYNEDNNPPTTNPNVVEPIQTNPYVPPPPPPGMPQPQPFPASTDPYASGQYYPYGMPYIIPLPTSYPQPDPVQSAQERSKSEVIAAHQKDADLSRLEVYHFTPKQNTSLSMGGGAVQPIVQYHVYPGMPPPPRPQQQYPAYPQPWYGQPPYVPSHVPEPYEQMLPPVETKARSAQTEEPSTKSRGVSPFYFPEAAPVYDDDGYPYVHHRTMHTDRYNLPTGRINQRFYDYTDSSAINDCRCLDCQRERSKVLNYYPD